MTPQPKIFMTTCGSEQTAQTIASTLVEERLAACVNVVAPVNSTYRWEGKVVTEREWLLIIKAAASRQSAIGRRIRELSGYDLPEFVAIDVVGGSSEYLNWLLAESSEPS